MCSLGSVLIRDERGVTRGDTHKRGLSAPRQGDGDRAVTAVISCLLPWHISGCELSHRVSPCLIATSLIFCSRSNEEPVNTFFGKPYVLI